MAEKRMFTKKVIDSDAFLDMPLSAQALYFHLCMRADDDGFVNNPKKIMRMVGSQDDDIKLLLAKNFVIAFETGIIVIKHWWLHNTLRKDRYQPTAYTEEKGQLEVKDNKVYTQTTQNGNQLATQYGVVEESIDKCSSSRPNAPSFEQVKEYIESNDLVIDPKYYYDRMEADNWTRYDKRKKEYVEVKNWKRSILNWDEQERKKRKREDKDSWKEQFLND